MEISLKTEPSGEYGIAKLTEHEIIDFGLEKSKNKIKELIDDWIIPYELVNLKIANGLAINIYDSINEIKSWVSDDVELINLNQVSIKKVDTLELPYTLDTKTNESLYEDGYYCIYSKPTKNLSGIDIPGNVLDGSKLQITYKSVSLSTFSDSYGDIENDIIDGITYDGVKYDSELYDNMTDRGFNLELMIFQIQKGEIKYLFKDII